MAGASIIFGLRLEYVVFRSLFQGAERVFLPFDLVIGFRVGKVYFTAAVLLRP